MLFTALSLAAPVPDTSEEELKKIQGEWVVVKMAWLGDPIKTPRSSATIDRDNLTLRDGKGADRYKIKHIRSGEIDLIKETKPAVGELHIGIYSLDGNSFEYFFAVEGPVGSDKPTKRPTKYDSPPNSRYIVYFLERMKETKNDDKK